MPAAGSGLRFAADLPKQYLPLAGRTIIECALQPFLADGRCVQLVVALAAGDARFAQLPAAGNPRVSVVTGGAQRSDSVLAALLSIAAADDEWVLVHDAARPCVTRAEIDALLAAAKMDPVGALLAQPLADTLKRGAADGRVRETPARDALWRAQTPQAFRLGPLRTALTAARAAGRVPTDEAQAMEWQGQLPLLVSGSALNLKITEVTDLALAAMVLAQRGASP
ncbi:MAG TPA: 2-C-methyl-D-erythritol 4-phosphate cytidylyltransferase [Steroidobacteraceae bacterium]|nr:2-C-methyl-D-erythritol 4-phosphate cytidylyltransferase [Steroidobacteraceae bacterium]